MFVDSHDLKMKSCLKNKFRGNRVPTKTIKLMYSIEETMDIVLLSNVYILYQVIEYCFAKQIEINLVRMV